ncbi:hypothetical protein Pla110_10110 [Polystyrenella longa]|uniref:Uncharacterized protein n=1 Tax=Polystyrenella longa TaxID=2528007 RepID=A0A518CJA2_9PLAN|nr:hypothetical protein Pla110_10110 [Polystyrenella longa]
MNGFTLEMAEGAIPVSPVVHSLVCLWHPDNTNAIVWTTL